ncbi:hypothetical protein DFP76_104280 [Marinomonas aquiplantarum]|uniref:Uncharacterized protein n=1 Tax=Marinomonas aquiplantarum TaxID=491951 RepID=A0A366D092_9GAMM|nr:hypothetical protein DFP76_104280 [Marinomonas aquiplantarum]
MLNVSLASATLLSKQLGSFLGEGYSSIALFFKYLFGDFLKRLKGELLL